MNSPKKVVITGAAGQISYSILFRIASGQLFGTKTPVILSLLEVDNPAAKKALEGVGMELDDCAFDTLHSYELHTDPNECFKDANCVFLIGAKPRSQGMERKDLLEANAQIFTKQGEALGIVASRDVKVLVVGNPANTNCLITMSNAKGIDPKNFTAMTRLDQNRAIAQVAAHTKKPVADIKNVIIWGNHSATQFPDISHIKINDQLAKEKIDETWYKNEMIATVQKRGAAIIEARGLSSAASAASSAIDHMRDWLFGTKDDTFTSMGVVSNGEYGIAAGLIYSFPCTCKDGQWTIVKDLACDDFAKEMMSKTETELKEEKAAVAHLL